MSHWKWRCSSILHERKGAANQVHQADIEQNKWTAVLNWLLRKASRSSDGRIQVHQAETEQSKQTAVGDRLQHKPSMSNDERIEIDAWSIK